MFMNHPASSTAFVGVCFSYPKYYSWVFQIFVATARIFLVRRASGNLLTMIGVFLKRCRYSAWQLKLDQNVFEHRSCSNDSCISTSAFEFSLWWSQINKPPVFCSIEQKHLAITSHLAFQIRCHSFPNPLQSQKPNLVHRIRRMIPRTPEILIESVSTVGRL